MKAITLWQPWTWLIFKVLTFVYPQRPVKRVETRSWSTRVRGRIAIHAAKFRKIDLEVYQEIRQALKAYGANVTEVQLDYLEYGIPAEQFGAVIGTVEIVDCVPIEQLYGTEYDTPLERACGDWSPGRYGWILKEPVLFDKPIPATGRQGLWTWEDEAYEDLCRK